MVRTIAVVSALISLVTLGPRAVSADTLRPGWVVAQNNVCAELRRQYAIVESRWKSLGGGTSGQAGAFYEQMQVLRNAMIASGC